MIAAVKTKKYLNKASQLGNNKGFTLLELLTVIALIAILTAITAPSLMRYIPKYHAKGATSDIVGKLMMARLKAIQTNTYHGVQFTLQTNPNKVERYKTVKYNSGSDSWSTLYGFSTFDDIDVQLFAYNIATKATSSCTGELIVFKPNGKLAANAASTGTPCNYVSVETTSGLSAKYEIILNTFTGNVYVKSTLRL